MKVIPETNNLYYASVDGEIFKGEKKIATRPDRANNGYLQCTLFVDKKRLTCKVHRLVASAHFDNVKGMTVNHIDGNKQNNKVANLELITHYENMQHAKELPSFKAGIAKFAKSKTKLSPELAGQIEEELKETSIKKLAKKYGVGETTMGDYIKRHGLHVKRRKNQYE